jgi:hypothetical protein
MMYATDMATGGILTKFLKIGTGVQAILRFCLRNLRGCNVGISEVKDL